MKKRKETSTETKTKRREGTKLKIPVRREYLNKKACLREARKLKRAGKLRNMSKRQIAREIYFHAVMNDYCDRTGKHRHWKKHADPINLRDGGDTLLRRAAYMACWVTKRDKK